MPHSRPHCIIAALLLAAFAGSLSGEDWPQWRGPLREGISKETGWNADLSAAKEAWRGNVGLGFSSMSVADGLLYTLGHVKGNEVVVCLDASTGKEKWRHTYPCALIAKYYEGGPGTTPTVEGGKVFVMGKEGQFFCLDAKTGEQAWYVDLRKKLGAKVPEWGYACSPLVHGDHVIVQSNCTAAFEKKTGKLAWKTTGYQQAYGSAMPFKWKDKTLIADLNSKMLIVIDAADGKVLAETKWTTNFDTSAATPIIVGDQIFISTGYGRGCALYRFTGDALEQVYFNQVMRNHMNSCVLHEGHLYGFDGNAHGGGSVTFKCIEFATGKEKWSQEGLGCGSVILADGKLIILSEKGELVIAEASSAGYKAISKRKVLDGRCWTNPVLANGLLYARDLNGVLVALAVK